jgi:phosphatidylinositol glycan class B
VLFALRVSVAFFICTTFVPDEYYQTVEPAFRSVYNVGVTTWEWSDGHQIRSFVPILPFIWLLKLVKYLSLDCTIIKTITPRVLQAILTAYSDVQLFNISKFIVNTEYACVVSFIHCLSWSSIYCLSRTLANSTETALIIIGVSHLLAHQKTEEPTSPNASGIFWNRFYSVSTVVIASLSAYIRPTSLLFWIPLFILQFRAISRPFEYLIFNCIPISVLVTELCILVDSQYYGTFAFTPLNFYTANISNNAAALFGVSPWHWNFSQVGVVILCLTDLNACIAD